MNPDLISTQSAAYQLGIHHLKFLNRSKILKLKPQTMHRSFYWTDEQIKKIAFYQIPKKPKKNAINKFAKEKIEIIELFLSLKNNSCAEIAKKTNQKISFVNHTINEFIKTKHIVVESKMNKKL